MAVKYSNSKIGKLFQLSTTLNSYDILQKARQRILRNKKNDDRDFQAFEDLLNQLYLGEKTDYLDSDIQNNILESIQEWISEQLINIDIEQNLKFTGSHSKHAKSIRASTVDIRLQQINQQINVIKKELESIDPHNFAKSRETLKKLQRDGERLITTLNAIKQGESIEGAALSKSGKSIQYTDGSGFAIKFLTIYRKLLNLNNLTAIYGEALERGLQTFSNMINAKKDEQTEELIKQSLNTVTRGSQQVNRGTFSTEIYADTNILQHFDKTFIGPFQHHNSYVNILSAYEKKQGKVDVIFSVPSLNGGKSSSFYISAKSWGHGIDNRHGFNSTTLQNALLRTVGFDASLAYGLVLGYYRTNTYMRFHDFARACALVDIVMGFSQETDYADTIVIENRSNPIHPISVYSVEKIFSDIINNLDRQRLENVVDGYNNLSIARSIALSHENINNGGWYIGQIFTALSSYKLSINTNLLK